MKRMGLLLLSILLLLGGCGVGKSAEEKAWALLESSADKTAVTMAVSHTNPKVYEWFETVLVPHVMETSRVELKLVDISFEKAMRLLEEDKQREVKEGAFDIILFEKGGFAKAYNAGLLYGPFAEKILSISKYYNLQALNISAVERIKTKGYIVPYGQRVLTFIYNSDVFYEAPETYEALFALTLDYEGGITYPNPETSLEGRAFVCGVSTAGMDLEPFLTGVLDEAAFKSAITPRLEQLRDLRPHLYKSGEVYPNTVQEMDALFKDGTLVMSMSLNPGHATEQLADYEYPEGARTFLIEGGMSSYVEFAGIPYNSRNKSGAMVVLNALLSPEIQAQKLKGKVWGNEPVFDPDKLDDAAKAFMKDAKIKRTSQSYDVYLKAALPPLDSYLEQIVVDEWKRIVCEELE